MSSPAVIWVIVAVIAAVVEISIPHFGLIFVTVAALVAALLAASGSGFVLQAIAFIVALTLCLLLIRPRMVSKLGSQGVPSRTDTLIGREGLVTVDIDATLGAGRVNVGGEDWAARASAPLPAGARIRVVRADGIVLEVVAA